MIAAVSLLLVGQATAPTPLPAASATNYPQPAYFLSLAESPLGFTGYVQCLGDYGEHLVKGTRLSVSEVVAKTRGDCDPVGATAIATMARSEIVREMMEEKVGHSLDGLELESILDRWLASKAEDWSAEFTINAAEFRASSAYDPRAYTENYHAEAAAGNLRPEVGE